MTAAESISARTGNNKCAKRSIAIADWGAVIIKDCRLPVVDLDLVYALALLRHHQVITLVNHSSFETAMSGIVFEQVHLK